MSFIIRLNSRPVENRRGRKRTKLSDHLKERRGYSHLKKLWIALCGQLALEEALDLP